MAGYIGSKTVNLSTTAANVGGDADIGGALDVGGAFTSQGIDDNANATAITIDSSENVGIGTSLPSDVLHVVTPTFGGMTLECTGATADPTFKFLGDSGNYWSLQQDASQGDSFQFRYNNSEKMRIDASGRVTKPYQPSFFASGNQGFQTTASGGTIVLDTTSFNVGSHYSTSTGRFTAPVAGKYFVSFTCYTQSTGTITLKKNGSDFTVTDVAFLYLPNNVSARSGGISGLIHLNANDYIHFGARNNQQVYYYQGHTTFSAFLIG